MRWSGRVLGGAAATAAVVLAAACGTSGDDGRTGGAPAPTGPFTLTSPDVDDDGAVPEWGIGSIHGICDGENRSPLLEWTGVPEGTRSFALTMTNEVAPTHVSWVVTGIPGDADHLAQADDGHARTGVVGDGFGGNGEYVGPCRPGVDFTITLYALDVDLVGDSRTDVDDVAAMVAEHGLGTATLVVRRPSGR